LLQKKGFLEAKGKIIGTANADTAGLQLPEPNTAANDMLIAKISAHTNGFNDFFIFMPFF